MNIRTRVSLCILVVGLFHCAGVSQSCETPPSNASETSDGFPQALPQGDSVTVYFDSSQFTPAQITAMEQAFKNWQSSDNSSLVRYTFVVEPGPPSPTGNGNVTVSYSALLAPDEGMVTTTEITHGGSFDVIDNASIEVNQSETDPTSMEEFMAHEIGHLLGLGDCSSCELGQSVMAEGDVVNGTSGATGPTPCDLEEEDTDPEYQSTGGTGGGDCAFVPLIGPGPSAGSQSSLGQGPVGEVSCNGGGPGSPIIIDTEGEGFHLTSAMAGVKFDISGTGHPIEIAWTDSHFHNAFLALPESDGLVHNGKDLFGNFTPQPPTTHPNGFIALAQFDRPENGGNGDGVIDKNDAVYAKLRLWIDENHDGICQASELHTLPELGVYVLSLNYSYSPRVDQFGNAFRYKATVNATGQHDFRDERQHGPDNTVGRWTFDVFFVTTAK